MKKSILKRALCVGFVFLLFCALAVPAFANVYGSTTALPASMYQQISQYENYEGCVYAFTGFDAEGVPNGSRLSDYFGSSSVSVQGDTNDVLFNYSFYHEFSPGEMTIYIFLDVEGFEVILKTDDSSTTVYCYCNGHDSQSVAEEDFRLHFTNDSLIMLPNNATSSATAFNHSPQSSSYSYLPYLGSFFDWDYEFGVPSDYGNSRITYTVTGWFCVAHSDDAIEFMELFCSPFDALVFNGSSLSPSTPVNQDEEAVSVLESMRDFVFSLFMAPSILLSSMLDFTIFGINLYTVVKVILTLCLVAFVVGLVVKFVLHLR